MAMGFWLLNAHFDRLSQNAYIKGIFYFLMLFSIFLGSQYNMVHLNKSESYCLKQSSAIALCLRMQVPRASASAVAFGLGLLSGEGKLGPGKNRAFSVLSESRASDICLRFFDSCETYKVYTLEWTDDLESFVLKGYGESINYRMGLPLLKDVLQSMEEAIIAKEENHPDGTYEKARLQFAHAETVVPFSCLLGLFLEGSDFEKIQREE